MFKTLAIAASLSAAAFAVPAAAQPLSASVDLLEVHLGKGEDHLVLESFATVGEGANQFVLKLDAGSDTRTAFDDATVHALYSREVAPGVKVLGGARRDIRAGSDLTYGALGIETELVPGLAAETYAWLSQNGDLTGELKAIAGVPLLPGFTLEPRAVLGWSAQEIAAEALGSGLTDIEASVRLRRELLPNLNAYVGVVHERLLGNTRAAAIAAGDVAQVTRAVVGVGFGF